MVGVAGFLIIYVLGGLTLLPMLVIAIFFHAYFTLPVYTSAKHQDEDISSIVQPGDDTDAIKRAQKTLGEKFQPRNNEADVAAGYFACVREYTPGGVNGKPPERTTPVGSTSIATNSPSVYQSMYRSIFDRKPSPSPLDSKGVGKPQRKGGNIFYVVLRHGHLMLFDDEEQLEVRHVLSLAHHHVSIYSGGEPIPEGELFIKRNALCLSRRADVGELTSDGKASKPFFLFSENCSDKEDFYFALLRNQDRRPDAEDNPPVPLQYDVKDIITLVQRLHSSEEHLQTRWMNAIIGRIFLALYKTPEVENFVRAKITKKISRVKTPAFLSKIVLRKIDMGESAPVITNPRLKDLTVDGELIVEADVRYTGNFRLEVAATARIELGTRFKAREVDLVLAVVLKRIEGHVMVRIKPPPSNRLWMTFETMPKIDMTIEPIVSSRQITYTLILRQIENRIKEVIAESLVFPNWDDSPFYHSEDKLWRGGIWADERSPLPEDPHAAAAQQGDVDEVQHLEAEHDETIVALPPVETSINLPIMDSSPSGATYPRKTMKSSSSLRSGSSSMGGSSTSVDSQFTNKPRALRSGSFANASQPVVSMDGTNADALMYDHSHAIDAISSLSQSSSPAHTPVGSPIPARPSRTEKAGSQSSTFSLETNSENNTENDLTPKPSVSTSDVTSESNSKPQPPSPSSISNISLRSEAPSTMSFGSLGSLSHDMRRENSTSSNKPSTPEAKRISLQTVTNVAATAKKWGWSAAANVIQRRADQKFDGQVDPKDTPSKPLVMGRGRPLPPPGTPLPPPDRKTKTAPIPVPKRKPISAPTIPPKHLDTEGEVNGSQNQKHAPPPPPLPKRRSREDTTTHKGDGLLVVPAPANDSEPTTPTDESAPYMQPWVEDVEEIEESPAPPPAMKPKAPRVPKRRPPHRVLSSSPEEDGRHLPSWMAAQEEEARAKSTHVDGVDEDMGV